LDGSDVGRPDHEHGDAIELIQKVIDGMAARGFEESSTSPRQRQDAARRA